MPKTKTSKRRLVAKDDDETALDEAERRAALEAGHDLDRVLTTADLVSGENIFFCATGITDGEIMEGVRYTRDGPTTHSIVMRSKSGTIRDVLSEHRLAKLSTYAAVDFGGRDD